jgi:site-specific recombinase XerD
MTPLRQRFIQDLQLRNYSPRTVACYVRAVARFAAHFGRSPELLDAEHTRQYQLHLLHRKVSWSRFNQAVCALRFFYRFTLQRPDVVVALPYGKKPKSLPCVLSTDEVAQLFAAVTDPRDRLLLQAAYACGLRISELVHLRVDDVDSARMVLAVRGGKGQKDRLVPLSPVLLARLREYWREYRPTAWLFPGQAAGSHLSTGQVQRMCRRAVRACGISKKASMHTLRHSYATHLLESGTDLLTLQKLLGHNHLSTTALYVHLEQSHLQKAGSPLDTLHGSPASRQQDECLLPAWTLGPSSDASPRRPSRP